jgi:antitoxin CcdA
MSTPTTDGKRATNITVDAALLAAARALKVNVSQASEEGLARAVAERQAQNWLQANQAALESSNDYVAKHGLPLARFRNF